GIDPHNKVDDLVRDDFADPLRSVWRNDDHVTGSERAAHAALYSSAARAGAVEHFYDWALRRNLPWILQCPARYKSTGPLNHVIDLGDLAVLDAAGSVFAGSLGAMDDTDADIVFTVDTHDANGLIADAIRVRLLHHGLNFCAA